jgi:hypothetical protein
MKIMNKIFPLLIICLVLSNQSVRAMKLELSLSPDSSRAEDFLIIKHPEQLEQPEENLDLSIQASSDLATWETVHHLRFKENSAGEIEAHFLVLPIDSGFNLNPTYNEVKRVDIVPSYTLGEQIHSEISDADKEVRVFVGNYKMEGSSLGFTFMQTVQYAERSENQFFRIVNK